MIDPRAVIQDGAELHPSVEVGPFAVVGPNVKVGKDTVIGPHALVEGWTTIGEGCKIFGHAVVGSNPQDLKYAGEKTLLEVGDRTMIREFATVNLGTEGGGGLTKVGDDCLLMAYSHVAHDCIVGNNVVMANAATLAGHITVDDWVIVGGLSGNRAKLFGLNAIGLKRRGVARESIKALQRVYKEIFRSSDPIKELVARAKDSEDYQVEEVKKFVDFIAGSERGVTR
jgi:UDP-N-acetylglucosamine acyltransferase